MPAARRSATRTTIGKPLLDGYRPSLLDPGLYHADGQIDGEVYNYGSFLQSKMYAAGVTCSNCHEPHSLKLRAEGNAVCAQCHLPSAFDTAGPPFPHGGPARQPMRRLPHAGQDLHGGRPAPRSRLSRPAPGPRPPGPARRMPAPAAMPARTRPGPRRASPSGTGPNRRREPVFGQALAADRRPRRRARRSVWSGLPTIRPPRRSPAPRRVAGAGASSRPAGVRRDPARRSADHGPDGPSGARSARLADARSAAARPAGCCRCVDDPVRAVRLDAARVLAPVPTLDLPPSQRAAARGRPSPNTRRRRRRCSTGPRG